MNHYLRLLAFVLCIVSTVVSAQSFDQSDAYKYTVNFKQIIPGAPEASGLGAYGSTQVNTASGLPNIDFNLYTIEKDGVSVPISISYSANGIRYNDLPSPVGLKWFLNAGGSINRTINGRADEEYLLSNLDKLQPAFMDTINQHYALYANQNDIFKFTAKNSRDYNMDNYYYSFPGKQGSMYINPSGKFTPGKDYSKLTVSAQIGGIGDRWDTFEITDEKGNRFIFNGFYDGSAVYNTGKYNKQSHDFQARISWKLKQIITVNKQTINFEYLPYYYEYSSLDGETFIKRGPGEGPQYCAEYCGCGSNEYNYSTTQFKNTVSLVSKIYTDDVVVDFHYEEDPALSIWQYKLKDMQVHSVVTGKIIKRIDFSYGRYISNGYLMLQGFTERNTDSTLNKPYSFSYYSSLNTFGPNSKSRDIYGYFNNEPNATLMGCSAAAGNNYALPIANRTINKNAIYCDALRQITYPTGGITEFAYEPNTDTVNGTPIYAPGMRVSSVKDMDGTGKVFNQKFYYYKDMPGYPMGDLLCHSEPTDNITYGDQSCPIDVMTSEATNHQTFTPVYGEVLVKSVGDSGNHYTKNYYTRDVDIFGTSATGLPTKIEQFLNDTTRLIQTQRFEYALTEVDSIKISSYILRKPVSVSGALVFLYWENPEIGPVRCPCLMPFYDGFDQDKLLYPRITNLIKETTTLYSDHSINDSLVVTKNYNYYANPIFLKEASATNSKQELTKVETLYPFNSPGDATADSMVKRNMLAYPLTEKTYRSNTLVLEKTNQYKLWPTSLLQPEYQKVTFWPSARETKLNFISYDSQGNLLEQAKENDVPTVYLWDYKSSYPVVQCTNATASSIAYTSFEADGTGNWSGIDTSSIQATGGITGRKYYNKTSFSLSKSGLTTSTYYVVSYRSKSGSYSIAGTQSGYPKMLNSSTVGGVTWTLYEHLITGQSTITITGSGAIDELRLYPKEAQMTTYTYDPLIGMTSLTDVNNRITYYEYDGLGRLSLIRDQDQNILKKYCYNYWGQPENCGAAPLWQSTSQTRCKPCPENSAYTTNIQQHQEKDNNPYSSTYNTTRWVDDGVSGSCVAAADWQLVSGSCQLNASSQNTGYQTRTEKDMNPCSSTYNTTRTITIQNCTSCPKPANWQSTGNLRCVMDGSGNYTGYQEREEKDLESCSATYNQTRWVSNGQNATACPSCNTTNCSGVDKKCLNNTCETGIKIYTGSEPSGRKYLCTFHYEWSDGSWSEDYTELSNFECFSAG